MQFTRYAVALVTGRFLLIVAIILANVAWGGTVHTVSNSTSNSTWSEHFEPIWCYVRAYTLDHPNAEAQINQNIFRKIFDTIWPILLGAIVFPCDILKRLCQSLWNKITRREHTKDSTKQLIETAVAEVKKACDDQIEQVKTEITEVKKAFVEQKSDRQLTEDKLRQTEDELRQANEKVKELVSIKDEVSNLRDVLQEKDRELQSANDEVNDLRNIVQKKVIKVNDLLEVVQEKDRELDKAKEGQKEKDDELTSMKDALKQLLLANEKSTNKLTEGKLSKSQMPSVSTNEGSKATKLSYGPETEKINSLMIMNSCENIRDSFFNPGRSRSGC